MKTFLTTTALSLALFTLPLSAQVRPTDQQIADAIVMRCEVDPIIPKNAVKIAVEDGVATITGATPTHLGREQATEIALSTRGVVSVVNRVTVTAPLRADGETVVDVKKALADEPATEHYEIHVAAKEGAVTLSGTVQSIPESTLAARAASTVRGVRSVENRLRVRYTSARSDAEIATDVRRMLDTDVWLNGEFVKSAVKNGIVTLNGVVGSAAEKSRAASRASVMGATQVRDDDLKVDPFVRTPAQKARADLPPMKPEEIRESIELGFLNDPRIMAFKLEIDVREGGSVALSGLVDNQKARLAAGRVAEDTFGVREVKNFLKVAGENSIDDKVIQQRAEAALARNADLVDGSNIEVSAEKGVLKLTGSVTFPFQADLAEDVVLALKGAIGVENKLLIDRPLNSYRPHLSANRSYANSAYHYRTEKKERDEAAILRDVRAELEWTPGVDATGIKVSYVDGAVILDGTVIHRREIQAAGEAARVRGGLKVVNRLKVGGT